MYVRQITCANDLIILTFNNSKKGHILFYSKIDTRGMVRELEMRRQTSDPMLLVPAPVLNSIEFNL